MAKEKPLFKCGTTQVDLPDSIARVIRKMSDNIPDSDLDGAGRDTGNPHITVRWGVTDGDPKILQDIVNQYLPFYARLGKTKVFPPSPSSDGASPVFVNVESPMFEKLHQAVSKQMECLPYSFPEYHPHTTVAYVKPSVSDKYVDRTDLEGSEFMVTSLTYSDRYGKKTVVELQKK